MEFAIDVNEHGFGKDSAIQKPRQADTGELNSLSIGEFKGLLLFNFP